MALVYVQRIVDTILNAYVRYDTLAPTVTPTDTTPMSTGPYDDATHEVLAVYDDPSRGVGGPLKVAGALQQTLTTIGSEVLIGAIGAFNPSDYEGSTVNFEVTALFSPGTSGSASIMLYDVGTRSTPIAGILRATYTIPFVESGRRKCVSMKLTVVSDPDEDSNEIFNSERVYEIRAILYGATVGDILDVENASIAVVSNPVGGVYAPAYATFLTLSDVPGLSQARQFIATNSIRSDDNGGGGSFIVDLVNDETSPGPDKVYGTDSGGVRGWQDSAGGGGSSAGPVIWRPGDTDSGNVYGSWTTLRAAVLALPEGQRNVIVDTSMGAASISEAYPYTNSQCHGWSFTGYKPGTILTIAVTLMNGGDGEMWFQDLDITGVGAGIGLVLDNQSQSVTMTNCNMYMDGSSGGFYAFGTLSSSMLVRLVNTSLTSPGLPSMFLNRNVAGTFNIILEGKSLVPSESMYYLDSGTSTYVYYRSPAARYSTTTGSWMTGSFVVVDELAYRHNAAVNETQTGTAELLVGALYLRAGTTVKKRSVVLLGGSGVGETANLYIRRFTGGTLMTTLTRTGTLQSIPFSSDVTISDTDWYGFYLAGGGVSDVAVFNGYCLDVE